MSGLNTFGGSTVGHGSSVIGGSIKGVLSNHLGGNNTRLGGGLGGSFKFQHREWSKNHSWPWKHP